MHLSIAELSRCLRKAADIAHQHALMHIGADDPVRSIPHMVMTCQNHLGATVRVLDMDIEMADSAVYGCCINRGNNEFDICLVKGLPDVWRRFVLCKELFHVLIDTDEYRNMDISGHIDALTLAFPDDDSRPVLSIAAEFLAEVAAMEFLLPIVRRQQIVADAAVDFAAVAAQYQLPQMLVEKYLSTAYMNNLAAVKVEDPPAGD